MSEPEHRRRLDQRLVALGLAPSRSRAADAVRRGVVRVDGVTVSRPGAAVPPGATVEINDPAAGYVSRAALKLVRGLEAFGFDPAGRVCLDVGASTGGFTQILLARGAARVHAVDVGHGQLDPGLAADPRVVVREGVNARALDAADVPEPVGAVVADVSFISLRLVLPPALARAAPDAWAVALFKPQFELGRAALGKGGIVRDPDMAARAAGDFGDWIAEHGGWRLAGIECAPIAGGDGNVEYLIGLERTA